MTETIQISERYGSYLSSRRLAGELRQYVSMLVDTKDATEITVDFSGVESISNSFIDGFLGLLLMERGRRWLDHHVRLIGLSSEDRDDIEAVLTLREREVSVA